MSSLSVYDHVRPTGIDYRDGTYRVVGTTEDTVTLLRVADAGGLRRNTGQLITVSDDEIDCFTPSENPDGNRPSSATIASILETSYWSMRVFAQQLAAHPLLAALAVLFVVVGSFGEQLVPLSDGVLAGLVVVGSLGVAYIGSGRL